MAQQEVEDSLRIDDEVSPLENATKRSFMWSSNNFNFIHLSRFLQFFGVHNGTPRFFRWAGSKAKLEGIAATIGGVPCVINGLEEVGDSSEKRGVVVHLHGGGFVLGSLNAMSPTTAKIARDAGTILIAVDYGLAPDQPFPCGLDDCLAVVKAVLDSSPELPEKLRQIIDPNRVVLLGDSAGGNFVFAVALDLIRQGDSRLAGVVAINPWLQAVTLQYESCVKHNYLNLVLAWGLANYAGITDHSVYNIILQGRHVSNEARRSLATTLSTKSGAIKEIAESLNIPLPEAPKSSAIERIAKLSTEPRAWPLLADSNLLAKLPRTFLQLCTRDPFRDEGLVFAERAQNAGARNFETHLLPFAQHCESIMAISNSMATEAGKKGYAKIIETLKSMVSK